MYKIVYHFELIFLTPVFFAKVTHHGKKQIFLIFCAKFAQKLYVRPKTRQMNNTIEFSMFDKVLVLFFILIKQF